MTAYEPEFPRGSATRRNAGIVPGRPVFTWGELRTLGFYLKAAYIRDQEIGYSRRPDIERILRKVLYYMRNGMPAAQGVAPGRRSRTGKPRTGRKT